MIRTLIVAYEFGSLFLSASRRPKAQASRKKQWPWWKKAFGKTLLTGVFISRSDSFTILTAATTKRPRRPFIRDRRFRSAALDESDGAKMAEHGDDRSTAIDLWKAVYDTSIDPQVKDTAVQHLTSLRAEEDIEELEQRVKIYRERTGALPSRWLDMVRAGVLPGLPQDPNGARIKLLPDGTVAVQDPSKYRFLRPQQ